MICTKLMGCVVFLALVELLSSVCADDVVPVVGCDKCGCCVHESGTKTCGRNETINYSDYCYNGCKTGYWGNRCYHKCYKNCLACARNPTTEMDTYPVCTECRDGQYSGPDKNCSLSCPNKCLKCLSYDNCSECKYPYLNTDTITNCSVVCAPNCLCEIPGHCTSCKPGFYDINNDCRSTCPDNCEYCVSANDCVECIKGRYGKVCEFSCSSACPNDTCSKQDDLCECDPTYVDMHCLFIRELIAAGDGCDQCGCCVNVSDTLTCGRNEKINDDDYCYQGCKTGFWGYQCSYKCASNCLACARNPTSANAIYPVCTECPDGQYSGPDKNCSLSCPNKCLKCLSYDNCSECKDPYLNTDTITNCSVVCAPNCICEIPGHCTSCKPGFYDINNHCLANTRLVELLALSIGGTLTTACIVVVVVLAMVAMMKRCYRRKHIIEVQLGHVEAINNTYEQTIFSTNNREYDNLIEPSYINTTLSSF